MRYAIYQYRNDVKTYPCGQFSNPDHECSCIPPQIQKYMSRISGPLLDRIDIHIEVPAVKYKELSSERTGEASEIIRERVQKSRLAQDKRFEKEKIFFVMITCNPMKSGNTAKWTIADRNCLKMPSPNLDFLPGHMIAY